MASPDGSLSAAGATLNGLMTSVRNYEPLVRPGFSLLAARG
jgi:hypothetical protein